MTTTAPSGALRDPLTPASSGALRLGGVAVAGFAYLAVIARGEDAELGHLGIVGLISLAALLGTGRGGLRVALPALATAWVVALWVLPEGLLRSSAAGVVLTISWALCAVLGGSRCLSATQIFGLAFALQVLERSDVLVTESGSRAAVILWLLPTVFAASVARLQARHGRQALLAALLVLGVAGQITLAATLLFALAATTTLPSKRWAWSACLALGLVAIAWSPALGVCMLLAALRLLDAPRWPAALMVAGGVLLAVAPVRDWDLPRDTVLLFLCAPLLWTGAVATRAAVGATAAAAGLAIVGLRYLDPAEALIAPALLIGLSAAAALPPLWKRTQLLWSLSLVVLGSLLANYPWHRDVALDDLASAGWPLALALGVVLVGQEQAPRLRSAALVLSLVLLAAWPTLQARHTLLGWPPQTLDAERPTWTAELPPALQGEPLRIVVDSRLADARDLGAGTRCASLELLDADGAVLVRWPLRSGLETAEWAADRDGGVRPASFHSTLDAEGEFFGRTYRAVFIGRAPRNAASLRMRRQVSAGHRALLELRHVAVERGRYGRFASRSSEGIASP